MKKFSMLLFVLIGFCVTNSLGQSNLDSLTEKAIIDSVWNLKEVHERNEYVIKESGGKRMLSVIIYMNPEKTKKEYYWIKVAEDNGANFVSHYNFYVYPSNLMIMYFDPLNNEEIELSKWQTNSF